jgi:ribonuclease R
MSRKDTKKKEKGKHKAPSAGHYKGVLDITRSGIGYVMVENLENDILVRPADFNTALHGDTVRVSVGGDGKQSKRLLGKVTEVVKRKQTEFLGRIEMGNGFAFFVPDSSKPMPYISADRIIEWSKRRRPCYCEDQRMGKK